MEEKKFAGDVYPKFRAAAVQTAPVFLDRDATIEKIADKVKEAAANGAKLVVFPESFVPTFPYWCLFLPPVDQHPLFKRLYENAVEVPGPAFARLQQIARDNGVYLSVGVCEKSTVNFGTMWNTSLLFDDEGNLIGHHRKILPTWGEKLVWSFGDGSSLTTHETALGRIGTLICGENSNTLARYALGSQGEQVHISIYPACWPTFRAATNYEDCLRVRTCGHAFESKVYNICCSAVLDEDAVMQMTEGDEKTREWLLHLADENKPYAMTMIASPAGVPCSEVLTDNEDGIAYADIDIANEIAPKGIHDIYGAYQRFDIFQLHINRTHRRPAYLYAEADSEGEELFPYTEPADTED